MTVYRIEATMAVTFYVKANSPKKATTMARAKANLYRLPEISDRRTDDPELPEVSISPAVTILNLDEPEEVE